MPGTAIILLALVFSVDALAAGSCGERVLAFNTYEDYDDQMNKEIGVSVFPVVEFTPHSSFEGLLVSREEEPGTKIELEVRRAPKGKELRKKSWEVGDWKFAPAYLAAEGLSPADFLGFEPGYFVLRLVKDGKTLCEDSPRPIQPGD